ncbi:MAG: hypothetical protein HZC48_04230 [Nitrospirae bacterium]|nr:hypothetical protein [Nitrospirota bacterium]
MSLWTYKRIELAENQLKIAIGLFVSGGDKFSVISLAGAADVILCRLVLNLGKENFTEFSLQNEKSKGAPIGTKESHGKDINDTLFINHLKHMDEGEDGYIDIDVDECALGAISKALANYVIIAGRNKDFVQAFLAWVRLNLDPKKYNIYCEPNWSPPT